jgi:hypothetical protein
MVAFKGFDVTSLDAKRYGRPEEKHGNIRIDANSTVVRIVEKNDKEADIEFRYSVNYTGEGHIIIEGRLIFEGDAPALAKSWGDTHNMPNDIAGQVHTAVMRGCIPIAVQVARELKLQLPIPLPNVKIQDKGKDRGGGTSGIEVA